MVQLPNAASLNRTDEVVRRVAEIALETPGVRAAVQFPGLSIAGFTNSPNSALVFFGLDAFEDRTTSELYGLTIAKQLNMKLSAIQDAQIVVFPPPPVQGLGTIGGFKLQLEDRADLGYDELYKVDAGGARPRRGRRRS